jgi:hypothetical protein
MNRCLVCGCETSNKLACKVHTRLNSQWKSCNNWRKKRGLTQLTLQEYQIQREIGREKSPKPRLFTPQDCVGPNIKWDGKDRSPCRGCAHQEKDKFRYGCVTCVERWLYSESHGDYLGKTRYSNLQLSAVELSR